MDIGLEFYPPVDRKGKIQLRNVVGEYSVIDPYFASVTFGAGGSTRPYSIEDTFNVLDLVRDVFRSEGKPKTRFAAHLTCVGTPEVELPDIDERLYREKWEAVTLFGDLKKGQTLLPDRFKSASELARNLRRRNRIITVAGDARNAGNAGMDNLRDKIDNGAGQIMAQCHFNPRVQIAYRDKIESSGITNVPVIICLMPIVSFANTLKIARSLGIDDPDAEFAERFLRHKGDPEAEKVEGEVAFREHVAMFESAGIEALQIITFNQTEVALPILKEHYKRSTTPSVAAL